MPVHNQTVDYSHNGVTMHGYLVHDAFRLGKRPAVIICHEWWGLNDYIRQRAGQIAIELGYVAFALDMYGNGQTVSTAAEAGKLMNALMSNPNAKGRVQAGFDRLLQCPEVDAERVAAIGYCMGGSVAFQMARAGMPLKAVVSFHGGVQPDSKTQPGQIKAKVLLCQGDSDAFVPREQFVGILDELKRAGADYQANVYGNAAHAFTNPNADRAGLKELKYNALADRRSWTDMKQFLAESFA
jgi:dienelactone hydrolase